MSCANSMYVLKCIVEPNTSMLSGLDRVYDVMQVVDESSSTAGAFAAGMQ